MSDKYELVNPILKTVMQEIYAKRTSLSVEYLVSSRIERINDKSFCQLFFLSKGCSHDLRGGCTMCNYGYGKSRQVNTGAMLAEMRSVVEMLPDNLQEIVVGPIGSMFDDEEVEPDIRESIFELLSSVTTEEFTCETRVDTITEEKLHGFRKNIRANKLTLEIGVETVDPWCLRNCINKNLSFEQTRQAIKIIRKAGMHVCANVGVGQPFINDKYSAYLAIQTIRKLLELDVDCIVLFVYNIRPGTLLEWLYEQRLYDCTSLWIIPEVLSAFSPDELRKIQISWYRNYYNSDTKIIQMPHLCPKCRESVLKLFDDYRNDPSNDTLKPIMEYSCDCREVWQQWYQNQPCSVDFDHVSDTYTRMANYYSISDTLLEQELHYMYATLSPELNSLDIIKQSIITEAEM